MASTILKDADTQDMQNGLFTNKILDQTPGCRFQNSASQYVIPSNRINSGRWHC